MSLNSSLSRCVCLCLHMSLYAPTCLYEYMYTLRAPLAKCGVFVILALLGLFFLFSMGPPAHFSQDFLGFLASARAPLIGCF